MNKISYFHTYSHLVVFCVASWFLALCGRDKGTRFLGEFLLCNVSLKVFSQGPGTKLDVELKVVMIRE